MNLPQRLAQYAYLMRLHKPIGTLLLLWPTLWALWLAGAPRPDTHLVIIFVLGVIVTRAAGCIINDYADRHVDGFVKRTQQRPLASGKVSTLEALILFLILGILALLLAWQLNYLSWIYALLGAGLIILYPFMKRFTHLPQVWLGMAFAWGIPMAFAAQTGKVGLLAWFLFVTTVIWIVIYDTLYAMTDREDDLRVGIKSTAILFGQYDRIIIGILQFIFVAALVMIAQIFKLNYSFYLSVMMVVFLFIYQQFLIKERKPEQCFRAFLNNNWVGTVIFLGILGS
jgi:4-hydroxybenzoate polyprenyltransferase